MVAVDPPRLHGLDCQVEATDLPIESLGRGLMGGGFHTVRAAGENLQIRTLLKTNTFL